MKDFALGIILKVRVFGTRKRPINCDPKLLKYLINTLISVRGLNPGVISELQLR